MNTQLRPANPTQKLQMIGPHGEMSPCWILRETALFAPYLMKEVIPHPFFGHLQTPKS